MDGTTELERCVDMNQQEALEQLTKLAEGIPDEAARKTLAEIKGLIEDLRSRVDSAEIGTPGKMGAVKVYFDASDPIGAMALVKSGVGVCVSLRREYELAQAQLSKEQGGV